MIVCQPVDIQTREDALPIRCFTQPGLLPEEDAHRQLVELAGLPELTGHMMLPRAIDAGVNCGMRVMATSLNRRDLTPSALDKLFGKLLQAIPLKAHRKALLTPAECEEMLVHGIEAVARQLDLTPDEFARTEGHGRSMPELDRDDIRKHLPPKAIKKGLESVGTIGAGNHFLEMQEIAEIIDDDAAAALGVTPGQIIFMLHSDSRRLGKKLVEPIRDEAIESYERTDDRSEELWSVPVDSDLGFRYRCVLAATMHAGYANRAAITAILRRTMRKVMGDRNLSVSLVYDCAHESILREPHHGELVWVHRHGASHAVPPGRIPDDPVLDTIGQPIPVAGCMGTDSYLAVAAAGVDNTYHSVAHGAGRIISKRQAAEKYEQEEVEAEMVDRGIRLYRYHADDIGGQAPASFKNVSDVVDSMTALDLIKPVARCSPVAVLKG
jgi:tRNA-splicing ligase RtcB